jgi:hypothetical protein
MQLSSFVMLSSRDAKFSSWAMVELTLVVVAAKLTLVVAMELTVVAVAATQAIAVVVAAIEVAAVVVMSLNWKI